MSATLPAMADAQAGCSEGTTNDNNAGVNQAQAQTTAIQQHEKDQAGSEVSTTSTAIKEWFNAQPDLNVATRVFMFSTPLETLPWQASPLHIVRDIFMNRDPQAAEIICTTDIYNPNLFASARISSAAAQRVRNADYIDILRTNPSYLSRYALAQKGAKQGWRVMKDYGWWLRIEDGELLLLIIHGLDTEEEALFEAADLRMGIPDGIEHSPRLELLKKGDTMIIPMNCVYSFAATADTLITEGYLFYPKEL